MGLVLILGAKSDIAKALAEQYAFKGYDLYLACRAPNDLMPFATDLAIRTGREVTPVELDILATDTHRPFYEALPKNPQGVLTLVGYLGDQGKAQAEFQEAQAIIETNFSGLVSMLHIVAEDFERRQAGFIVGFSSVAGERGRQSNYVYGAAKAGFTTMLSGLRNRLHKSNVQVMTVKPGFMDTAMTADLDLPARLTAQPSDVAELVYSAQQKGRDVIYTGVWRWLMLVIRNIPERIFKRMSL